ncbi:MAG: hypothetical protein M1834_005005 [Cirrosporium novae-zelandiae]|nr:MAG: hypothetical protein M1834_005005 [Cirrosporium novae-zelandiae]
MPSLNDLECMIESPDGIALKEFSTLYGNGIVDTFVVVPQQPGQFSIHLKSNGYVAPGLAMFVYMDGIYQCNRNRLNLTPTKRMSLRVRQKEERLSDGAWIGRPWSFEQLSIIPGNGENYRGPKAPHPPNIDLLGTIEVIVLRCQPPSSDTHCMFGALTPPIPTEPVMSTATDPEAFFPSVRQTSPPLASSPDIEEDGMPFTAFFDGPADVPDFSLDGPPPSVNSSPARRGHRRDRWWGFIPTGPNGTGFYAPIQPSGFDPYNGHGPVDDFDRNWTFQSAGNSHRYSCPSPTREDFGEPGPTRHNTPPSGAPVTVNINQNPPSRKASDVDIPPMPQRRNSGSLSSLGLDQGDDWGTPTSPAPQPLTSPIVYPQGRSYPYPPPDFIAASMPYSTNPPAFFQSHPSITHFPQVITTFQPPPPPPPQAISTYQPPMIWNGYRWVPGHSVPNPQVWNYQPQPLQHQSQNSKSPQKSQKSKQSQKSNNSGGSRRKTSSSGPQTGIKNDSSNLWDKTGDNNDGNESNNQNNGPTINWGGTDRGNGNKDENTDNGDKTQYSGNNAEEADSTNIGVGDNNGDDPSDQDNGNDGSCGENNNSGTPLWDSEDANASGDKNTSSSDNSNDDNKQAEEAWNKNESGDWNKSENKMSSGDDWNQGSSQYQGDGWKQDSSPSQGKNNSQEAWDNNHNANKTSQSQGPKIQPAPVPIPQPHWTGWKARPSGRTSAGQELTYWVTEDDLHETASSHQVQPGYPAHYAKRCVKPEYLDTHERPYAVFVFKYRSKEVIESLLNISIERNFEAEASAERLHLSVLSKEEIIQQLLEARGLTKKAPNTPTVDESNKDNGIQIPGAWPSNDNNNTHSRLSSRNSDFSRIPCPPSRDRSPTRRAPPGPLNLQALSSALQTVADTQSRKNDIKGSKSHSSTFNKSNKGASGKSKDKNSWGSSTSWGGGGGGGGEVNQGSADSSGGNNEPNW